MSHHLATLGVVTLVAALGGLVSALGIYQDYIADFERMEAIEGTRETIVDYSKFRVIRNKNREYCANGTITFTEDLDEDFKVEVEFSYSPTGNSGYMKLPYAIPMQPACEYLSGPHEKYSRPSIKGHSNFPIIPPNGTCLFPKGTYYVSCATAKTDNFPTHINRGLTKIVTNYYKNNEKVGGIIMYLRISDKM